MLACVRLPEGRVHSIPRTVLDRLPASDGSPGPFAAQIPTENA